MKFSICFIKYWRACTKFSNLSNFYLFVRYLKMRFHPDDLLDSSRTGSISNPKSGKLSSQYSQFTIYFISSCGVFFKVCFISSSEQELLFDDDTDELDELLLLESVCMVTLWVGFLEICVSCTNCNPSKNLLPNGLFSFLIPGEFTIVDILLFCPGMCKSCSLCCMSLMLCCCWYFMVFSSPESYSDME